jgi:hypothetical protein
MNPKKLVLHFSDFSTIFYAIYKNQPNHNTIWVNLLQGSPQKEIGFRNVAPGWPADAGCSIPVSSPPDLAGEGRDKGLGASGARFRHLAGTVVAPASGAPAARESGRRGCCSRRAGLAWWSVPSSEVTKCDTNTSPRRLVTHLLQQVVQSFTSRRHMGHGSANATRNNTNANDHTTIAKASKAYQSTTPWKLSVEALGTQARLGVGQRPTRRLRECNQDPPLKNS